MANLANRIDTLIREGEMRTIKKQKKVKKFKKIRYNDNKYEYGKQNS